MSVIGEIHASLDAMGVEQQACVFAFLMSYPLVLGSLLERRGRRLAGAVAAASALGFVFFTDPWMHAVLLVVLGIGGVGVFIAAVYLADYAARRIAWRGVRPELVELAESTGEAPAVQPAMGRERVPIGTPISVKS